MTFIMLWKNEIPGPPLILFIEMLPSKMLFRKMSCLNLTAWFSFSLCFLLEPSFRLFLMKFAAVLQLVLVIRLQIHIFSCSQFATLYLLRV